jgi:hypothetical protein
VGSVLRSVNAPSQTKYEEINVAFAPSEELFLKEVDAAFQVIGTNNRPRLGSLDLFVPIMSYIRTEGTLRFPETFPPERRQQLL